MGEARQVVGTVFKWAISLGIGALFVWLSLDELPSGDVLADLRIDGSRIVAATWSFDLWFVPIYFLTLVVMHVFRVWRWRPLLRPLADVDFFALNRVCSVGFLAVFVLPMRFGELVRPALLPTVAPVRRSAALATIVVERLVDGVMVAGFLAVALVFMPRVNPQSYEELRFATIAALFVFAAAVGVLVLLFAFRRRVTAFVSWLATHLTGRRVGARLTGITERFTHGLSIFPDARSTAWFLLGSLMYWCSNGLGLFVLAKGFVGVQVDLLLAFAMMSTIVVGMMIPNAPANVGSFWFFLLLPTKLYGPAFGAPQAGLAFALAVWAIQFLQLIVFGGWFIANGSVPFRRAFSLGAVTIEGDDEAGARAAAES